MPAKRQIKSSELLLDIRNGLTNAGLMEKYGVSAQGLLHVFRMLVEAQLAQKGELNGRMNEQIRQSRRCYPVISTMYVMDVENPASRGYVQDLSEQAVQVIDMPVSVGDTRSLQLHSTTFQGDFGCLVEARCVQVDTEPQTGRPIANLEITRITEKSLERLRVLIQSTTFCDLE